MAVEIPISYSFKQRQSKSPNWCKLVNSDNEEKVTVGSVNNLYAKLLLPASADNPLQITYQYKDVKETITASDEAPIIPLDLTDKIDLKPIKIKMIIGSGKYSYAGEFELALSSEYLQVNSLSFAEAISTNKIFELSENITVTNNLDISHDAIIQGNGKTINLNGYSLTVKEGVSVKIYNVNFENGNPLLIQEENSALELYDCRFEDCTATDYEGLGSVIHCDIDLENLSNETDFKTTLEKCDFTSCAGAILHDGELIVNNCNFLMGDELKLVNTAPSFLYQTGGEASIRNSNFDISLDTDYFCQNEINVKLGQCLILCGETAVINTSRADELLKDDNLKFFGNPYNNQSHIFIKYYYSPIHDCVFISPVINRENKSLCYSVQGVDWIFKQNVQITRASWETENRNGMGG